MIRFSCAPQLDGGGPGPEPPSHSASRRLTLLYVFALSTVAVLSIGAQWLIQQQLRNGESDSRVINVAGRQRMLSQRLAKASLLISSPDEALQEKASGELAETLELWVKNHLALQDGDLRLGLPGHNSDEVRRLFQEIDGDFNKIRGATRTLISGDRGRLAEATAVIQRHEGPFLRGMDRIVSQLVVEAERRVARLGTLEWAILALTLVVLLAEGLFIFRPAAERIQQTMTHLSLMSENLRRSRDEAEEANQAKSRFLANVSHELRTPMTAVLGMTELAQRTDSPEELDRYLKIVEESGATLLGLLNDLIDLSQVEADALELRSVSFSPHESVRRVVRMMGSACRAKGVRLIADLQGEEIALEGDPRRLEQVLVNLVANAIKWTDSGEVRVTGALTSRDGVADLTLTVQDTGAGITDEQQKRVFEPFHQAESGGPSRGGVGLGLAICQRLTEAMGGRIDLHSRVGDGTTVSLELCLPHASAPLNRRSQPEISDHPRRRLSILVVEDVEVNQLLLRKLLEADGNRVEVVASGEEALRRCASEPYDAILIDHQLPGIDGVETAERLRVGINSTEDRRPRLLCVSAHAGLALEGLPPGAFDAFVSKPIDIKELLAAVHEATPGAPATQPETEADGLHKELVEAFIEQVDEQRNRLALAIRRDDWKQAALCAHRFRGQVGYFESDELAQQLGRFEELCKSVPTESRLPIMAEEVLAGIDNLKERLSS